MTVYDETVDDSQNLEIFDPDATWKRKEVYHFEARELLVPIYQKGKLVYKRPGKGNQRAVEFAVAASALKHTVEGDYNMVTAAEVEKLADGDGSAVLSNLR